MPEPIVRADIEAGRLVRLNLRDMAWWRIYHVVHSHDRYSAGPAGRWLIERLVTLSDSFKAPTKQVSKPTSGKGCRKSQKSAPVRRPRR
jgi:hypothetical protein